MKQMKVLSDIGYAIVAEKKSNYYVAFGVYRIELTDAEDGAPVYMVDGKESRDPDGSEALVTGQVKWDGCSDWNFGPIVHGCTRKHVENISAALVACWDWAEELMPIFEGDVE